MVRTFAACSVFLFSLHVSGEYARAEDRAERVHKDLKDFTSEGRWIYNDLPKGFEEAKKSGKPLLVVLRCIPCEACRGFDEGVASFDKSVDALLE
jgi:serine protease Do